MFHLSNTLTTIHNLIKLVKNIIKSLELCP